MSISVRELGLADEAAVIEVLDAVTPGWVDALAPGASGPRAFVADGRSLALAGYVDDRPAGWLWGTHIRRPDGARMTYVHELEVVDWARRRGLASMLVEAAVGAARRAGSTRLWLVAETGNEPADRLYRSLGSTSASDTDHRIHRWDLA